MSRRSHHVFGGDATGLTRRSASSAGREENASLGFDFAAFRRLHSRGKEDARRTALRPLPQPNVKQHLAEAAGEDRHEGAYEHEITIGIVDFDFRDLAAPGAWSGARADRRRVRATSRYAAGAHLLQRRSRASWSGRDARGHGHEVAQSAADCPAALRRSDVVHRAPDPVPGGGNVERQRMAQRRAGLLPPSPESRGKRELAVAGDGAPRARIAISGRGRHRRSGRPDRAPSEQDSRAGSQQRSGRQRHRDERRHDPQSHDPGGVVGAEGLRPRRETSRRVVQNRWRDLWIAGARYTPPRPPAP